MEITHLEFCPGLGPNERLGSIVEHEDCITLLRLQCLAETICILEAGDECGGCRAHIVLRPRSTLALALRARGVREGRVELLMRYDGRRG